MATQVRGLIVAGGEPLARDCSELSHSLPGFYGLGVEQNWGLRPLTRLDASAGSIMGVFDFSGPPRKPAVIPLQRARVELYASIAGTSSQVSVWLDGMQVGALSGTQSLGTDGIGYLQLGDTSTGNTFDVAFDDVRADPSFIQP